MSCIYCLCEDEAIYKNNFCPCVYHFHKECLIKSMLVQNDFVCPLCRKTIYIDDFVEVSGCCCCICCICNTVYGTPDNQLAKDEYNFYKRWCCLASVRTYKIITAMMCVSLLLVIIILGKIVYY